MVSRESEGARILSVDVGSSSVRAELYDDVGDSVEGTEVKLDYEFEYTPDGGAEKDADELLDLVVRAVDGTLSEASGAEISGVAMSTFWHSVIGLDRDGRPTTPILTWADRRAAECILGLRERLDERANHRRTGCVPHSSYWPAKLLWSSCAMPGAFEKTERWVSPADYFYARFFGEPYQVGTSMASGTGLFDQNRRKWDRKTLEALPAEESQLSAISDEPRRGLAREWAERWPALQEAPWLPAVGDGACSNVGSGCMGSDRLALMVGTSGAMRVLWKAVHVVVVGRTFPQAVYESSTETEAGREDLRREAQEILDEQVRKIEQAGGDVAIAHLKFGERPNEAIVHLAEDIGADLIVIGSPGFGGLRRALMGNVADSVVRHAHCPVTVVRPAEGTNERRSLLHRLIPSSFVGPS